MGPRGEHQLIQFQTMISWDGKTQISQSAIVGVWWHCETELKSETFISTKYIAISDNFRQGSDSTENFFNEEIFN